MLYSAPIKYYAVIPRLMGITIYYHARDILWNLKKEISKLHAHSMTH